MGSPDAAKTSSAQFCLGIEALKIVFYYKGWYKEGIFNKFLYLR